VRERINILIGTTVFILLIGLGVVLPLVIMKGDHNYIEIESDKDFNKYKFEGTGSADNPFVIENQVIENQVKRGISISNTKSYFVLRHNRLDGNLYNGIRLSNVQAGTGKIYNNTIINHSTGGIYLTFSDNIEVYDNFCNENKYGIWVEDSNNCQLINNYVSLYRPITGPTSVVHRGILIERSDYIEARNNYFRYLQEGVSILHSDYCTVESNYMDSITKTSISIIYSSNIQILQNTCNDDNQQSIYISYSNYTTISNNTISGNYYGINLHSSNLNTIIYNSFQKNYIGIYSSSSSERNTVKFNEFINNTRESVKLEITNFNSIHHNSFYFNNLGLLSQAKDQGLNNTWFDELTLEGNFWNEWSNSTPYPLLGDKNNTDPYPLASPISLVLEVNLLLSLTDIFNFWNIFVSKLYQDD